MSRRIKPGPFLWGCLILVISQVLTILVAFQEKAYVELYHIASPNVALSLPLAYFFGAVVLWALILFLIPVKRLRVLFRLMFALLFAWGIFIALVLFLPLYATAIIATAGGLAWLLKPRVWLHNLLLIFALVGVGSIFGFFLSPRTAIAFMLVISIYDILAVRFGFMLWMAEKFSAVDILPAFIIPRSIFRWNMNLKEARLEPSGGAAVEREFAVLGGGDVGLALVLFVSAFFAYGFTDSVVVAVFSLLGLISAFLIQFYILKGKPMPAMPPITFLSLIGLLIVYFVV